jgi:hypothetical protein
MHQNLIFGFFYQAINYYVLYYTGPAQLNFNYLNLLCMSKNTVNKNSDLCFNCVTPTLYKKGGKSWVMQKNMSV